MNAPHVVVEREKSPVRPAGNVFENQPQQTEPIGATTRQVALAHGKLLPSSHFSKDLHYDPKQSFLLGRTVEDDQAQYGEGEYAELTSALLGIKGDAHIALIGETRGGKGVGFLYSNLCLWEGSAVVIDPKGELASVTAAARGKGDRYCTGMGQNIFIIDPFRESEVSGDYFACINPLDWLRGNHPLQKARILAQAIMPDEDNAKNDAFWDNGGRTLLINTMLHVATAPDFPFPRTLTTVFQLIQVGDEGTQELLRADNPDNDVSAIELLFHGMIANPVNNGSVSRAGKKFLARFKREPKQIDSFCENACQNLNWIEEPAIAQTFSKSDFSFSDLQTNKATAYITTPDPHLDHKWIRLIIDMFLEQSKEKVKNKSSDKILMIIDEFPLMRKMVSMEKAIGAIAGAGIRVCIVIQALDQLKKRYPDDWELFLSSADAQIYVGTNHLATAKYACERIGEREVIKYARTYGTNRSRQTSHANTKGRSHGVNRSRSDGRSEGVGEVAGQNEQINHGRTHGYSFDECLLGLTPARHIPFVLPDTKINNGKSKGKSTGSSRSQSRQAGRSSNYTEGENSTDSNSSTETDSLGEGESDSVQEQFSKEPVLTPNEMFEAVAQLDHSPTDPRFPGQALVLLRGNKNFLVRTVRYYNDEVFYRRFSDHPTHGHAFGPRPYAHRLKSLLDEIAEEESREFHHNWLRNDFAKEALQMAKNSYYRVVSNFADTKFTLTLDLQIVSDTQYGLTDADRGWTTPKHSPAPGESLLKLNTGQTLLRASQGNTHEVSVAKNKATVDVKGLVPDRPTFIDDLENNGVDAACFDCCVADTRELLIEQWQSYLSKWEKEQTPVFLYEKAKTEIFAPYHSLIAKLENVKYEGRYLAACPNPVARIFTDWIQDIFGDKETPETIAKSIGLMLLIALPFLTFVFALGLPWYLFNWTTEGLLDHAVSTFVLSGLAIGSWVAFLTHVDDTVKSDPPHPLRTKEFRDPRS